MKITTILKFSIIFSIKSIGDTNQTSSGFVSHSRRDDKNGLWDITIYGKIKQSETVIDPSDVHCLLFIPNTSYTKQKEVSEFSKLILLKNHHL